MGSNKQGSRKILLLQAKYQEDLANILLNSPPLSQLNNTSKKLHQYINIKIIHQMLQFCLGQTIDYLY